MPRPRKWRKVCCLPNNNQFGPLGTCVDSESMIQMTVDEYETLRLIDREGLSQEQCGASMQIARTTVQQIYAGARRKLADFLVDGCPPRIEGGDYRLCQGGEQNCGGCFKQPFFKQYAELKGADVVRIAVTYEDGRVFQHFGHTQQFKIYDIADGKMTASRVVDTGGSGHGALAGVLNALGADTLICGGIGGGAQEALAAAGIRLYGGVSGMADDAVKAYLAGNLDFNPNVQCNHHGHEHGHSCGEHHCGENKHGCAGHGA